MAQSQQDHQTQTELPGDTPMLRLFALLELVAAKDEFVSLQGLVEETSLPKPTVHRMLRQLENAGLLVRQGDGRNYSTGARLHRFAENLLLNSTQHGARHAVLRKLVDEIGESCNLTALSGSEVIYLDRVETPEPLRFYLRPGSTVPVHCSASGKMILSQLGAAQRRKLLGHAPLTGYTSNTVTDLNALETELKIIRDRGYALDDEEYLSGLICVAIPVPTSTARSNLCIAVQAPAMRLSTDGAAGLLPSLHRAAASLSDIELEGTARGPLEHAEAHVST